MDKDMETKPSSLASYNSEMTNDNIERKCLINMKYCQKHGFFSLWCFGENT